MKKTKAFIVSSRDLFDPTKNPKGSLSVKDTMRNLQIEKRCLLCNDTLLPVTIYEHGKADENLYCLLCEEGENVSVEEN